MGSALGVSDDAPVLDSVYKLVAHDGRPVRKTSTGKAIWPGAKQVWRALDWSQNTLALAAEPLPAPHHRALLGEVMRDGRRSGPGHRTLAEANNHFEQEWAGLPGALKDLTAPTEHPFTEVAAEVAEVGARLAGTDRAGTDPSRCAPPSRRVATTFGVSRVGAAENVAVPASRQDQLPEPAGGSTAQDNKTVTSRQGAPALASWLDNRGDSL